MHTTSMREPSMASGPPMAALARDEHLLRPLLDRFEQAAGAAFASRREGDHFADVTVKEFVETVRNVAAGLVASGVAPGDRVALMSHTRLEWMILDYAILAAGAVTVPIYDTSSPDQVRWIMTDSEAVMLVVETTEMAEVVAALRADLPMCRDVLTIDDGALDELESRGASVDDA